jgi:Zn-dependent M28 family amino/carboxypeptidase
VFSYPETQWRTRVIKIMLWILLVAILLLLLAWFWLTQPLLGRLQPDSTRTVDPARLEAHVRKLSIELAPRDVGHLQNLDQAAAYIAEQLKQTGASVSEQPYRVEGSSYRNVIARFGPDTSERIVVGAHYDSAGPLPGADDNASGVAGLLELARLLGSQPPQMRVELVAFSTEEPPYFRSTAMGSSVHAISLKNENVKVRAMLSLEMIGYFSDAHGSQHFPTGLLAAFYPSTGNFISVVGRVSDGLLVRQVKKAMSSAAPLPVHSINAPGFIPGVDFSDQLNYWEAGYGAVMITDTAFYRNRNYHTAQDTAEKLDYKRMALVVEGVYAAVTEIAR